MARVNLCPNPALKNNATDYFGGGVRVTGVTNMVRTAGYSNSNATSTLPRATVTAGRTYRFSAYVKGNGGASNGNANINWYSNGSYLSSAAGAAFAVTDGQVTRVETGAQVAPTGADQALLNITGADAGHIVTGVLYEESASLLEFFDGDSDSSSWNGTDGSSTSTTSVGDSGEQPPPSGGSGNSNSDEAGVTQGWGTPIYNEEFDYTGTPNSDWDLYGPGPGHIGNGRRLPQQCTVTGGVMRISGTSGGDTGGMAHQVDQLYGRWEVRVRAYATGGSGEQYHPVCIIWPGVENWPRSGEYDFQENDVGDTSAGAFIHYPHPNLPVQQEHATQSGVKIGDWHNYAIDWQPTGITGYIDGRQWYHFAGGGGPAGRSDIQGMTPNGHLTLQLDNFTGAGGLRPANMDIEWVRVWNKDSVSQNNAITATGIPSAEGFAVPLIGNRFRMYLTNDTAPVSTGFTPAWEQTTGAVQKALGLTRAGANTSVTVAETSTSNTFDVAMGQWVSPPMTSAGTLQGAFSWVIPRSETNTSADFASRGFLKVVSNDGTVVRGVAADRIGFDEFGTTLQAFNASAIIENPVTCQVGDRVVFEAGYRAGNVVSTSYSATIRYGGTAGDVEAGDTGTNATTLSPWINFADKAVERLFRGQDVAPTGVASATAFGTATLTQPPTRALTGVGGIASAEAIGSAVVHAEAAIIAPAGIAEEAFGSPTVKQYIALSPAGVTGQRTNLCPNPSLKVDTTGWFGSGSRITNATGLPRETAYEDATGTDTTGPKGSVTAGLTYRFSGYVKGSGGASTAQADINWYSGGSFLSSSNGPVFTVGSGEVVRVDTGAFVAPATADQGLLNIINLDNAIQASAYLYEQTDQLLAFFDGDSPGASWTGSVGNSTSNAVSAGIPSVEAFGSHRVRRLSDIYLDDGIASAEAFGAATLVHFQTLLPVGIDSAEAFGFAEVEDPARIIRAVGIDSAELFGFPTLAQRLHSGSIASAEAFGERQLEVKRASWKLVNPTRVERHRLGGPLNVIYVTNVVGLTVLGSGQTLRTVENPKTEDITSAQYVWLGGRDNISDDEAIHDLWVANGYDVEMKF